MKIFFQVLLLFTATFYNAQVNWMSLSQAIEAQKKVPKKIFISFTDSHCQTCQSKASKSFENPIISQLIMENFYPVRFYTDSRDKVTFQGRTYDGSNSSTKTGLHPFAKFMNISSTPTLVFLDEHSETITSLAGDFYARDLEPYFSLISTESYKTIKTRQQWDDYQRKFRSKIKD